jgi:hypothetical protein
VIGNRRDLFQQFPQAFPLEPLEGLDLHLDQVWHFPDGRDARERTPVNTRIGKYRLQAVMSCRLDTVRFYLG